MPTRRPGGGEGICRLVATTKDAGAVTMPNEKDKNSEETVLEGHAPFARAASWGCTEAK